MIKRLRYLLILGVLAKILVDTATQIFSPFLVIIGTGIGVGTLAMGRLVAIRSLMGVFAPVLGSLADRIGYRAVMRISLALTGIGMILGALSENVYIFALSMIIGGIGSIGFTPNLHAYLSARLPYEKRAMGLGIAEYSWALAGIGGLFISGLLIDAFSWKIPFYLLGGGLIFMAFFYGNLPSGKPEAPAAEKSLKTDTKKIPFLEMFRNFFDLGDNAKSAWANTMVSGLTMFAMVNIIIIHGGWLDAEYGIGATGLGFISLLFGLADLTASVTVSLFVDRIGKRRSVIIGVLIMILGFILFPFLNRGLIPAVLGIIIPRIGFEFAIVSNFSLLSEQAPERRGQILGLGATFAFVGSSFASLTGPAAYLKFGVWGLAPVSLGASLLALVLLLFFIHERSAGVVNKRG